MRGELHRHVFLRAAVLCAVVAFGLGPETADAQMDDPAVPVVPDADGVMEHADPHSRIQEAQGDCRPGRDCAVAAISVEPTKASHAPGIDGDGFRCGHIRLSGLGPIDEPPPPRGLALPEYGIVQT